MTEAQLNNIKNTCNNMLQAYKANINELLGYVASAKAVEIENADVKDDLDTILQELETQLNNLNDEMNVSL